MRIVRLAVVELAGASVVALAAASLCAIFGTLWTWACDADIRFTPLSARAVAMIAVPAFAMGWTFFLLRRRALRSRTQWVGLAFACAVFGSFVHRAVFLKDGVWDPPARGFFGEVDATLAVLVRRVVDVDVSWLAAPKDVHLVYGFDPSMFMMPASVVAVCAVAAALYVPVRRWLV